VRLLYSSPLESDTVTEPQEVMDKLREVLTKHSKTCILQGPFELQPKFFRREYWMGIMIKMHPHEVEKLIPQISHALPSKGWRIDIRPQSLLSI
jgi:hypothetical protein